MAEDGNGIGIGPGIDPAGEVTSLAALEAIYGAPSPTSLVKVADRVTPEYRAWIEASPFCALATAGPEGLDVSPRGDRGAVATVLDPRLLALPDRRGNNRVDTLRNLIRDPRCALLFLVPGEGNTIRVNGRARLSVAPDLLARFTVEGQAPRSVILVAVEEVYFQCARALMRSGLWNPAAPRTEPLPTAGEMLAAMSKGAEGGAEYDTVWRERAAKTLW